MCVLTTGAVCGPALAGNAGRPGEPLGSGLTDLEPVFSDRFPFEPARYEVVPDELPGLFPDELGELMAPAI
jgi:hypothetical protein